MTSHELGANELLCLFSEANVPVKYTRACAAQARTAWLAGIRAGRILERLVAIEPRYRLCPRCLGTGVAPSSSMPVPMSCGECDGTGLVLGESGVSAEPPTLEDLEPWLREMLEEDREQEKECNDGRTAR